MTDLFRVSSSAVEAVGYDSARRELHVVFTGGRRYAYRQTPAALFHELLRAESIGRFVNLRIKPHHAYREIDHGPARTLPRDGS